MPSTEDTFARARLAKLESDIWRLQSQVSNIKMGLWAALLFVAQVGSFIYVAGRGFKWF